MPRSPVGAAVGRPAAASLVPLTSLPAVLIGQDGFISDPHPAAPDNVALAAGDVLASRAAVVQGLLKTLSDAGFGVQDFDVYRTAVERLIAIGPYTQPLISGFQKPPYLRRGKEAERAVPDSKWKLAPWSEPLLQRFLTDAQMGLDDDHRSLAVDALQTLLTTLKTSHPQVVSAHFPALRDLALKGRKEVWPKIVKMLASLNDREWANVPMILILENRIPRAAEILAHSNHEQTILLLRHVSADVRQLMARYAAPEDIRTALAEAASDTDVRRSIIQGVGKIAIARGVSYAGHSDLLLDVLNKDPSPLVTADAGRALTHLDPRIIMGVVVRNMQLLRHSDPIKVARAAQDLLRLDAVEALRAFAVSAVERVGNDDQSPPQIRTAVERVLQARAKSILHPLPERVALPPSPPPLPAVPVGAVAAIEAPHAVLASAPLLSEWAIRSAALIESGRLLELLQSSNMRQVFMAIQTIHRAWGELQHLRASSLSAKLLSVATELSGEAPLYEPMRGHMVAWALRLDPQPTATHFMHLLKNESSPEYMKMAAAYALSVAPADVVEAREGRQYIVDLLLACLRDSRPLKRFEGKAMAYLPGFTDLIAPRLTEMIRWAQRKNNHVRSFYLSVLEKIVKAGGESLQRDLQIAIVPTTLGVNDLDIMQSIGEAGVSRMSELLENAKLSAESRYEVLSVLIDMGNVSRPSLARLAMSEFAMDYFDVLQADSESSLRPNVLALMVEFLRHAEVRPRAIAYLQEHVWRAVPALSAALKTTPDVAHQRTIINLMTSIGNGLLPVLISGGLTKNEVQRHAKAMEAVLPYVRTALLQEVARNPTAFVVWAEQMGREGEVLLDLMTKHADPRVQKLAMKALTKKGNAFLEWSHTPAGKDARAAETPEAAFRLLEGVRK